LPFIRRFPLKSVTEQFG